MFMLIIWLQGIWLPLHGYSFARTPFWAGVYMLPMTGGFLLAGPIAGRLSDRFGSRPFATSGMIVSAGAFVLLELLPIDFSYPAFAAILLLNGLAMGASAPNRAGVMNSLPARDRGAGGGMNSTFMNSAQVFSLGIFFSLMIAGLAASLPHTLSTGLIAQGVPAGTAHQISRLPPISVLFASFLGYNPIGHLLGGSVLAHLPAAKAAELTGRSFLPGLLAGPFRAGLHIAFAFSIGCSLIAAAASWSRGAKFVAAEPDLTAKETKEISD
jgi:MFS family permease